MLDRVAVVIGVNYTDFPRGVSNEIQARARINPLRFGEADAKAIAKLLQEQGYRVVLLVGAQATRHAIIETLRRQCLAIGSDGLLLVYFAGHGDVDPYQAQMAYLLPVDADPDALDATAIPLEDLVYRHLNKVQASVVLLDCCHSGYALSWRGSARPAGMHGQFTAQAQGIFTQAQDRIVLAACGRDEKARELVDLGHGAFTYYILHYWRNNSTVNDLNLYEYVSQKLKQIGLPVPVRGGAQHAPIELGCEQKEGLANASPAQSVAVFEEDVPEQNTSQKTGLIPDVQHMHDLIEMHTRRLRLLQLQEAMAGRSASPTIKNEIAHIEDELKKLQPES